MKKTKFKNYLDYIYIFLIGLITSFSLPPYNYWYLNFLTFSLFFILLFKRRDKKIVFFALCGYFFGFGYFLSSLYWIPISLTFDKNFETLVPFAIILIPAFLSLFYAFALALFRMFFIHNSLFSNILIFSLMFSIFEYLRGNIFSGFPWNLFAYSLSENLNIIQINSLIGVYAFNMIIITIFSSPSIIYLSRTKKNLLGFSLILVTFISFFAYGFYKKNSFHNLNDQTLSANIKVLSTNIPIERFYSNLDAEQILIKLIKLSEPTLNEHTIFIWPEGVIPNTNLKKLNIEYDYLFANSFKENHTIILGVNDDNLIDGEKKYYNSLSAIDNKTNVLFKYYKNQLVPFGEFIPFENLLSKIGLRSLTNNYQSYSFSKTRNLFNFKYDTKITILPLICYEIIYSGKLSDKKDYNFIVNISEDGWFGNSIGPFQHFAHTIFRSIEYGKYTLRSANNGISAIVDPTGTIIDKIDIDKEGFISIKQIKELDRTLFFEFGNKIYFLIILLYIFLIFSFKKSENE